MICPSCGHDSAGPLPPGRILRARRLALGITLEGVLEAAGSERSVCWLQHLETMRKRAPDMPELAALCLALGLDPTAAACGQEVLTG